MQLNDRLFRGHDNTEFRQAHLEHHVLLQRDLRPHHYERTGRAADVAQVELNRVRIHRIVVLDRVSRTLRLDELDLAVAAANEALTYNNIVACGVTAQRSAVPSYDIDIV